MKCNACGKIINNDGFICKECDEVNCLECRVKNPKGLKLPICTLCGTDILSPIWEEENKKEEDARLQIEIPGNLLGDWPKPELDIPELIKTFNAPKSDNCPECFSPIPNVYWHDEDMDSVLGKKYKFCSRECLREYKGENMCAECDSKLNSRPIYFEGMDSKLGETTRFCCDRCADKFRSKFLCNTCGSKIEGRYYYCFWCGDRPRYCSTSCLQDHSDNSNTFACVLRGMANQYK
jgi:hypothetical protein